MTEHGLSCTLHIPKDPSADFQVAILSSSSFISMQLIQQRKLRLELQPVAKLVIKHPVLLCNKKVYSLVTVIHLIGLTSEPDKPQIPISHIFIFRGTWAARLANKGYGVCCYNSIYCSVSQYVSSVSVFRARFYVLLLTSHMPLSPYRP